MSLLMTSGISRANSEKTETADGSSSLENQNYSGKQSMEWEKIQVKLSALKGKVDAQESVVNNMIIEKSRLQPGEELSRKIEELKKEHAKLEKLAEEYNVLNQDFQGKFPEKGLKEARIYNRVQSKSIDSMEEDLSLQGRINKLQNKILRQYPKAGAAILKSKEKTKKIKPSPEKSAVPKTEKKTNKDVTDPIILEQ